MNQNDDMFSDVISDLHKDAYGFRPSNSFWMQWKEMNQAQREKIFDQIQVDLNKSIEDEKRARNANVEKMESTISAAILSGVTRKSAIRGLAELHNCLHGDGSVDYGFLEYELGIPYDYFFHNGDTK